MAKKLTSSKAKEILHDKSVHGHPLTDKQRRFFGAIAGGSPIKAQVGENILPNYNVPIEEYQRPFINPYGYSFSPEQNPNVKIYGLGAEAQYDVSDRLNLHGGLNTQSVLYPGGSEMFMKPTYNVGLTYKFEKGGWLDKYGDEINANEGTSSAPEGWVGEGYSTKGRNYSPAWGGQFAMGGSLPGSVGFTYARTQGAAPSEGPYAKKTLPSAEYGMSYYQHGLDWKPKTISRDGSVIKDDMGYWNPDNWGKVVEIDSPNITMKPHPITGQEVPPLIGISDTGDVQYMEPGKDYKFKGKKVTEIPLSKNGGWLNKYK